MVVGTSSELLICVFTASVFNTNLPVNLFPLTCECFQSFLDLISFKQIRHQHFASWGESEEVKGQWRSERTFSCSRRESKKRSVTVYSNL